MVNLKSAYILLTIITMTLMLTTTPILTGSVLAVKKSSSAKASHKTISKTTTVNGVKVLSVHTAPSKVFVGNTFDLKAIVFNNSTATISFANGTCSSPLSITFNKNVITEPKAATGSCKAQRVTLKPGEHSPVSTSDITYRAATPGITNASMIFKYGVGPASSKSSTTSSYSRTYGFDIQQSAANQLPATTSTKPIITP